MDRTRMMTQNPQRSDDGRSTSLQAISGTIHVNPNFQRNQRTKIGEVHINPAFLKRGLLGVQQSSNVIHVNPKLINTFKRSHENVRSIIDNEINENLEFENKTKPLQNPTRTATEPLQFISKNKLIRSGPKLNKPILKQQQIYKTGSKLINVPITRKPELLKTSKFKYIRRSLLPINRAQKMAKILKYKYIQIKNGVRLVGPNSNVKHNAFKMDKRQQSRSALLVKHRNSNVYRIDKRKPVKKVNRYKVENRSTRKNFKTTPNAREINFHNTWKQHANRHKAIHNNRNISIVKIGGIFYKSSSNKLTRAKKLQEPKRGLTRVVYVRGEKFLMDVDGKCLRRHPSSSQTSVQRVDIGGVTYMPASRNLLLRTNTHHARHIVTQAKQRSIALLSRRWKKNNIPCPVYHHLGRCSKHERGICMLVHDPKNIALCKRYLKGICDLKNCYLSHNAVDSKVPTCHFYLEGNCTREKCPYLHVKLNKKAEICVNFLQGFCSHGQLCKKRHIYKCPVFDQTKKCPKGKRCPYPHRSPQKKRPQRAGPSRGSVHRKKPQETDKASARKPKPEKRGRYYMEAEATDVTSLRRHVATIDLPAYIPLNNT